MEQGLASLLRFFREGFAEWTISPPPGPIAHNPVSASAQVLHVRYRQRISPAAEGTDDLSIEPESRCFPKENWKALRVVFQAARTSVRLVNS